MIVHDAHFHFRLRTPEGARVPTWRGAVLVSPMVEFSWMAITSGLRNLADGGLQA